MKIVVTGATGFLGSWVCRILSRTHSVNALVRPDSSLYRLEGISPLVISKVPELQWGEYLQNSGADTWISLDWSGVSNKDRNAESQSENIDRLGRILEYVKSIPTIVGTGSQAELGPVNDLISEELPDAPTTKYGEAKVQAREMMKSHAEEIGSRFIWARIFSTYGALDSNDWLIPATIDSLLQGKRMPLTKGEQEWSYLHAYDLAKAFEAMLTSTDIHGIVSVGNPETVMIRDVANLVGKELNKVDLLGFGEIPYRPDQVMKLAPLCEKLGHSGWKPVIGLDEGIRHLINWMLRRPDTPLRSINGEVLNLHLPTRN